MPVLQLQGRKHFTDRLSWQLPLTISKLHIGPGFFPLLSEKEEQESAVKAAKHFV
jgi:hypothetical protein